MRTVALRLPRRNPKPLPVPRARAPPTPPIALMVASPSIDRPRDRASQDLKLLLLFLASHLASKKMEKLNFSAVTPAQAFQKCRAQKQRRVLEEEGEDQASRWRGAFGLWGREAGPWRPPRPQADPPDPRPVLRFPPSACDRGSDLDDVA